VEDGDISIVDGGGITELDPAGDRLLVDISGFADEWLLRSSLVRRSKLRKSVRQLSRQSRRGFVRCPLYPKSGHRSGHSRRQLFANAAIAASRVSAWPCVGVRSSWWPNANVHIHGIPTGPALESKMRPTQRRRQAGREAEARLRISVDSFFTVNQSSAARLDLSKLLAAISVKPRIPTDAPSSSNITVSRTPSSRLDGGFPASRNRSAASCINFKVLSVLGLSGSALATSII
jgi:hypothetical protein